MATKFLEPGGDATFDLSLWTATSGMSVVTDFVHGGHKRSLQCSSGTSTARQNSVLRDAGSRISAYFYFHTLPNATTGFISIDNINSNIVVGLRITPTGVLQFWGTSAQIGTDGQTLSTGTWYRISVAYTITSISVNRFEIFVDGVSAFSATNVSLSIANSTMFRIENSLGVATFSMRASDIYIDNSASLTDPGTVAGGLWVTAKRPFANGTTNGFTTQIGTGPVSGYGTGHAQQVNERALNTANGWSMVGAGAAVTEEYTIEGAAVGDIDVSTATIIDIGGWASCKALAAETGQLILAGVNHAISITTAAKMFVAYAGSTTYPAGGTDIGLVTSTALTTVSLYECGVLVACIPASGVAFLPATFRPNNVAVMHAANW